MTSWEGGDGRLGGACLPVAHLVLAFHPDGIRPIEDHDALFRFREAISVLACHTSFLGCRLFAVSLLWSIGLSEEAFEEFAVFEEVFDGVGVVGAWTVHEFVEVVRQPLLGLLARAIGRSDHRGVVRSAPILFVLLAPLCGGALVLVHALGLAFVPASVEDRSDRLLAGGVVSGDVEQVVGGMELQTSKLVDQGLVGRPREECADDV